MQPEATSPEVNKPEAPQAKGPSRVGTIVLSLLLVLAIGVAAWFAIQTSQLKATLASTQEQLTTLQGEHTTLQGNFDTLTGENDKTKAELEETKKTLATAQDDLKKANSDKDALQAKIDEVKKYADVIVAVFSEELEGKVQAIKDDADLAKYYDAYQNSKTEFEVLTYGLVIMRHSAEQIVDILK